MENQGFFFIGEPELVIGFRFAGVPGHAAQTREEALEAFAQAKSAGREVVIFSLDAAGLIAPELAAWQMSGNYPLVVEIPTIEEEHETGRSLLDLIRQAIGIRV